MLPLQTAAVTGTNGKTSVVEFVRQIFEARGLEAATLGTLGLRTRGGTSPVPRLPPGPAPLECLFGELGTEGADVVAVEAFSRNLATGLLDGLDFDAAAFTTLDRDHLDYHGTAEAYLAAKRRLFERGIRRGGVAVLNADAAPYPSLRRVCLERGATVVTYGADGDVRLVGAPPGASARVVCFGVEGDVSVTAPGRFMLDNAMCAVALCVALGLSPSDALPERPLAVPAGRMELAGWARGAPVYVDYAHTPGGLRAALLGLRGQTAGDLAVVVGCGGDPGKRPLLGAVADALADRVYVTDHTPTRADRDAVRADVLRGCRRATDVPGRARAIATAVRALRPDDALLVAGRGHERYALPGGGRCDDRSVVSRLTTATPVAGL